MFNSISFIMLKKLPLSILICNISIFQSGELNLLDCILPNIPMGFPNCGHCPGGGNWSLFGFDWNTGQSSDPLC